jgi:hypothetical protein
MTQAIHAALLAAMTDIAKVGIAKDLKASLGGAQVNYRGIERAMNAMSAVLIRAKISIAAEYSDLTVIDRVRGDAKDGKYTRLVTLCGAFRFIAEDGSFVVFKAYGEAMDTGDKAVTKAQSVAFRTALFQQFCIPTLAIDPEAGGDNEDGLDDGDFVALVNGIESQDTDAKALAYWKLHSPGLVKSKAKFARFKTCVQEWRAQGCKLGEGEV